MSERDATVERTLMSYLEAWFYFLDGIFAIFDGSGDYIQICILIYIHTVFFWYGFTFWYWILGFFHCKHVFSQFWWVFVCVHIYIYIHIFWYIQFIFIFVFIFIFTCTHLAGANGRERGLTISLTMSAKSLFWRAIYLSTCKSVNRSSHAGCWNEERWLKIQRSRSVYDVAHVTNVILGLLSAPFKEYVMSTLTYAAHMQSMLADSTVLPTAADISKCDKRLRVYAQRRFLWHFSGIFNCEWATHDLLYALLVHLNFHLFCDTRNVIWRDEVRFP